MIAFQKIYLVSIGLLIKLLTVIISKRENLWVFGSDDGQRFIDNSKYFFEYLSSKKDNEEVIWISRNNKLIDQLRTKGYKVYHNYSFKGLKYIIRAKYYVFSTVRSDVLFFFKTKRKKIINLWHGMPIKKIVYDYNKREKLKGNAINYYFWEKFVVGFKHQSEDYISATSDFFVPLMRSAFRNSNVYTDGLPRNDLFSKNMKDTIKKKYGLGDKFLITYMPTHRDYGKGELNPIIFQNNKKACDYFIEKNVIIVLKYHKNMTSKYQSENIEKPLVDLTLREVDPQELLYITDILITDYSSCFIDYLLLKRPIILYQYDSYETEDNDLYFNIKDFKIGYTVQKEEDLFSTIKKLLEADYKNQVDDVIYLFHKDSNLNYSESVYNSVKRLN